MNRFFKNRFKKLYQIDENKFDEIFVKNRLKENLKRNKDFQVSRLIDEEVYAFLNANEREKYLFNLFNLYSKTINELNDN